MSDQFLAELTRWTRRLRRRVADSVQEEGGDRRLRELRAAHSQAIRADVAATDFADLYAQAVACGIVALHLAGEEIGAAGGYEWLADAACPLCREVLRDCLALAVAPEYGEAGQRGGRESVELAEWSRGLAIAAVEDSAGQSELRGDAMVHFYERFLSAYDARRRARHGVFYTPRAIVRFVVRSADELLCSEFGLEDGLADPASWSDMAARRPGIQPPAGVAPDSPFLRVLDPALGTGAFLAEVIDVIHRKLSRRWRTARRTQRECGQLWRDYVSRRLLPRIGGLELMLPAAVVAHVRIASQLAETGYHFEAGGPLAVYVADTLASPAPLVTPPSTGPPPERPPDPTPVTVLLGNPPFSGVSRNRSRWIVELLNGRAPDGEAAASYYEAEGRRLAERKLWLQDDYVKFVRYAQWRIEAASCGLVGLVTNHGYLDNLTFRGMRHQLMRAFPRITVVDLHGNSKKKERSPDGRTDENVFATEQGVAIGLFRRPPMRSASDAVFHGQLWGGRHAKEQTLRRCTVASREALALTRLHPQAPGFFFTPRNETLRDEYEKGFRLTEVMPVHSTAPVTARDSFVVAFDDEELIERMQVFRDLTVPDEEIRRRYFTTSRSTKYPPGDTRSWKLPVARRRMADEPSWRDAITSCLYRPFDRRRIYWADWMVDWPREKVTRHIRAAPNLVLIARRQMPPTQPCSYFWVSDQIALDGVIRSDNRGSESLFPLMLSKKGDGGLFSDARKGDGGLFPGTSEGRFAERNPNPFLGVNLRPAFLRALEESLSLTWNARSARNHRDGFGPRDVAHYIYALFHSPGYRERYADCLRIDFPRVFLPAGRELFRHLCDAGRTLVARHLLRPEDGAANGGPAGHPDLAGASVAPGYPKFEDGRVYVNRNAYFPGVTPQAWRFPVGGRHVLRKWLTDRRGRRLTADEAACYSRMIDAVKTTQRTMAQIDRHIERHGGWPSAFQLG